MKFISPQPILSEAVQKLASIINPKTPSPILLNIHIEASKKNGLVLKSTDSDRSIHYRLKGVDVVEEGAVCLAAKKLADVVRVLSKDVDVVVSSCNEGATIKAGGTKFKINGVNPEDYPTLEEASGTSIEMSGDSLANMIQSVQFATAPESSKYSLNGMLVELDGDCLSFVASDGKRLAHIVNESVRPKSMPDDVVIIPNRSLGLLVWAASKSNDIQLILSKNKAAVKTDDVYVDTLLVNGLYPDYRQVLPDPTSYPMQLIMGRETLDEALRHTSQFVNEDYNVIEFNFKDCGQLVMSASTPTEGNAEATIDVNSSHNIKFGLYPYQMKDVLKHITSESFVLHVKDADSAVFLAEQQGDLRYFYLALPVDV